MRSKGSILTIKLKERAVKNEKLLDSDVVLGYGMNAELVAARATAAGGIVYLALLMAIDKEARLLIQSIWQEIKCRVEGVVT